MTAAAIILPVFLLTAAVSMIWLATLSDSFWSWIDVLNTLLGLAAAVITLFQVQMLSHEKRLDAALAETRSNLAWTLTRTEYEMENCGVWWGDVLEDYEAANDKASDACFTEMNGQPFCEMCRIGHLVGQFRSRAFDHEEPEWNAENLAFNICGGGDDTYSMCQAINAYVASAKHVTDIKAEKSELADLAGGAMAMSVLQALIAIYLGLQMGKIVHNRRKAAA